MSRFKAITTALRLGKAAPSHITPGPDIDWIPLDWEKQTLRTELENLYWQGIAAELENIIRTLQAWQEPAFADISNPEEDDFVHGFDFFIDQVSQEARKFAFRHGKVLTPRPGHRLWVVDC
jgi:soluble cytochrome b562